MPVFRTIVSAALAVALAACGGGGGGGRNAPTPGGTGTGGTDGAGGTGGTGGTAGDCSVSGRQDWVRAQIDEWYLFPELVDTSVAKGDHATVQSYIDALVAPARAQGEDRFFTYVTSIREENDLIRNGANAGFGFRLAYDERERRLFVLEVFETGPAYARGVRRGDEILTIGDRQVEDLFAAGGSRAVSDALGPANPGVTRSIRFLNDTGTAINSNITKEEFALDPMSDVYGQEVFEIDGEKIGYINLRTFIIQSAEAELRAAFQRFQNEGVSKVILDLRYNGGGLISVAEVLGDLLGADKVGQVFSRTVFRPSKAENNETRSFQRQPQAITASRIAVIGRGGTASASELVTNSMLAYLGPDIALVGTNTYGKPVGQIGLDRSACDDRLRVVAFKTANARGEGEYYRGLAGVMQATCAASDDIETPLGDPSEASIMAARAYLGGMQCQPIAGAGLAARTSQQAARRELLVPRQPSAAQFQNPGLF